MHVRLAFAVAAHIEPEILIVDEVLAVGDAEFQKKCLGKMEDVSKGGRTVLFVSHNMSAIRKLCEKSILLEGGELKNYGNTDEVISHYLSELSSEAPSKEWKDAFNKPSNGHFSLHSVRVIDNHRKPFHSITTDDEVSIECVFEILNDNSYAGLTILLYDHKRELILSSMSNSETEYYSKPMKKGSIFRYVKFLHVF
jgi:lipopolysaccharide transport system ATP-binding protein